MLKITTSKMLQLGLSSITAALLSFSGVSAESSKGHSPMSNFQAHSQNKCPNEWNDYSVDKRTQADPVTSNPPGLKAGPVEGRNSRTFDDGQGVELNKVGNQIKKKTEKDSAGPGQQTALSVPQGGPQPVTSSSGDQTQTDMTQPFMRPATMTGSEGERTTIINRVKRNAAPLGSTIASAAPAGNADKNGSQLWANLPVTANGASAAMMSAFGDQFLSASTNPAANALAAKADQQIRNMQNADNQGVCAQENCDSAFESITSPLINVANEDAATQTESNASYKEESDVIWMVQQMYKKCYVPMAILFLLPGAALTQLKSQVLLVIAKESSSSSDDPDTKSPFIGMIRAICAIFLIPATQLTISYCIDIGNALTEPIAHQIQHERETLMNWVNEQAYASNPSNQDNYFKNMAGEQAQGKLMGTPSSQVVQERQSDLSVGVQNMLNTINALMSQGLNVLNGFQLVMMCYLFLLGPIAAALFAWPASVGKLFKSVFAGWLDGVIVLSLWKFWWCIVLLCMIVRLGQGVDPNSEYEMYYYTAFMGILVMVPFQPFDFRPGDIVSEVLDRAQSSGGSSGGGSSGGGSSGSKSSGGQSTGGGKSTAATQGSKNSQASNTGNSNSGQTSNGASAQSTNMLGDMQSSGPGEGRNGPQGRDKGKESGGNGAQPAGSKPSGALTNPQPAMSFSVPMTNVSQPPRTQG